MVLFTVLNIFRTCSNMLILITNQTYLELNIGKFHWQFGTHKYYIKLIYTTMTYNKLIILSMVIYYKVESIVNSRLDIFVNLVILSASTTKFYYIFHRKKNMVEPQKKEVGKNSLCGWNKCHLIQSENSEKENCEVIYCP